MSESDIINLILTAATEGGGGFNWGYVGEHTINLVILLGVLIYFLRKPLKSFLIERRSTIGNEIDEAQKEIVLAKKSYEELAGKMWKLDEEIKSLKETIKKEGETERKEIVRQAELSSQRIGGEARETIRLETEKARQEIRSQAVSSAVGIAEAIIRQNLNESDDKRFVEDFIKAVSHNRPQAGSNGHG